MQLFPVPEVLFQIYSAVDEGYALVLQESYLLVYAAEGEGARRLAEAVYYPVARDMVGVGIDVQGVAHYTAPARVAREHGYLSVGRHPAVGYAPYDVIYQLK